MRRSRFKARNSKSRRAVSLLEVLFAILVTTIGLFGALALLPVASSQARKGRLNDATAVAASTCVHDFDARGMRRFASWVFYDTPSFGASVCIDPRFLSAQTPPPATPPPAACYFPYQEPYVDGNNNRIWDSGESFTDLNSNGVHDPVAGAPRMHRISLGNNAPFPSAMTKLMADSIFVINDDLTYQRADDNSLAPTQQFESLTSGVTSRRQTDGHMSWMATLVPKIDRYTLSFNETYVLSIVMFYDRPAGFEMDAVHERVLTIPVGGFLSSGTGGGEVLLTSASATAQADLNLRPNDWIMLSGIAQHAIDLPGNQPRFVPVFKWYRVSDTEGEATDDNNDGTWERYVTLTGPDWDIPAANAQAVVVEGVVGVYEKTIRLE